MKASDISRLLVPVLVGGLLLVSAALKADQLLVDEAAQDGLFGARWFLMAVVEFELMLGIWLLSGIFAFRCRQVVLVVFAMFAIVALQKGLSGESSCGCFGRLEVNPWWTFGLDLLVLRALWNWNPLASFQVPVAQGKETAQESAAETESSTRTGINRRAMAVVGLLLLIGIPISIKMLSAQNATLTQAGTIVGDGQLVILEPETWIGKPFPIASHIDIGDQLLKGDWIVVLFHHGCPECQEALPQYEQLAQEDGRKRIAVIEIPPYGKKSDHAVASLYGRLTDKREWFVQAPVEISVKSGMVEAASTELPSLGDAANKTNSVFSSAVP